MGAGNIKGLLEWIKKPSPGRSLLVAGLSIILFFSIIAVLAPLIAPYDPIRPAVPVEQRGEPQPPSKEHPLGTNSLGYDLLSRLIYGSRIVLGVVILSSLLSLMIGVPLGMVSGYYSGRIDRVMSMIMDSIYAFPGIVLAIAIASVLGPSPSNTAIALAVVYVPTYYRIVRGHALELRESLFIEALKSLGIPENRILYRHLFPNVAPSVLVVFGLAAADAILTEAGLSFFGLTVSAPTPDWGYDLYTGREYLQAGYWWLIMFPGLAIMLLALGFALVGEGLAERLAIRFERSR